MLDTHTRPQMPQLARSVVRSRHTPEQFVRPAWQLNTHALALQTLPAAQTRPHEPQLLLSVDMSRHTPAQLVRPAPHDTTQAPLEQV